MRFQGRYNIVLDAKGRLSIPAPFREQLGPEDGESLMVTCSDRCLDVYPMLEWEKLVRKFERLPQMREDVELFQLYYMSQAMETKIDKNGRILVPQTHRDEVGLTKEIVVVGHIRKFQVYAADVWEQVSKQAKSRFAEIKNLLSGDLS